MGAGQSGVCRLSCSGSVRGFNQGVGGSGVGGSGAGVGCHRFYKSELPTDGNYFDMIKECKNDKDCKMCVEATASIDPKTIGNVSISENDLGDFGELMSKPEQKCKLTNKQSGRLERMAIT